jgi:hypothetical protein
LESFQQGWETTDWALRRDQVEDSCRPRDPNRKRVSASEVAFCYFFERESLFGCFRGYGTEFYSNVRCGILHQGETCGGWKVERRGPLFEASTLTINATKFLAAIKASVTAYARRLEGARWDDATRDDLWTNFLKKMDAVIKHCER